MEPLAKKNSSFLIIIPAYNEEATIEEVVTRAGKYADVCVIDDNSTDATAAILKTLPGIHVIHHICNTHIPGGLIDGMQYAIDRGYEYAISLDAGLSHNPDEIPRFMEHPVTDMLIGVRVQKLQTPLFRRVLSAVGNCIYNAALDFPFSVFKKRYYRDITSGYRRYSYTAMKLLLSKQWRSRSFDVLFETAMYIYRNNMKIDEVPITYNFSNSSLNTHVVNDCLCMCLRMLIDRRR